MKGKGGFTVPDMPSSTRSQNKQQLLNRLRKIEGQVRGIYRMVDSDTYCVDVLNQVAACRAALSRVGVLLLETHIQGCVVQAIKDEDEAVAVDELMEVIRRFI